MLSKVTLFPAEFGELVRGPDGAIARFMNERGAIVQMAAVRDCPKITGLLSESIVKRWSPTLEGQLLEIVAKQPYAASVHEGSKPHYIPNAFGWGPTFGIGGRFGGFFHPGIIPEHAQPFLRDNLPLFFAS